MKKQDGSIEFHKAICEEYGFKVIPQHEFELLTMDGYLAEFFRNANLGVTYKKAWEMTEAKLFLLFGINRYQSASSMRTALYRRKPKK